MNEPRRRGPIARVLVGFWDALNFTRRLAFNLLFLLLVVLLLAVLAAGDRIKPLLERTTLVVAPEGALVEQYSSDPVSRALARNLGQGAGEVQLRDLLRALDAAKDDKRIERVLLRTDRMAFSGYASIREVAAAIARLKAAGKEFVAFGDYFETCTCSRSASTSPRSNPTCSTARRRRPRRPTCSG
jgi:protease IV